MEIESRGITCPRCGSCEVWDRKLIYLDVHNYGGLRHSEYEGDKLECRVCDSCGYKWESWI